MAATQRVKLAGSARLPVPGAHDAGSIPADERFEVTVRLRAAAALPAHSASFFSDRAPRLRRYLSRAAYLKAYGTRPADFAKRRAFAKQYGLAVVEESPARHSTVLTGTAAAFSAAFGVRLQNYVRERQLSRPRGSDHAAKVTGGDRPRRVWP